MFGYHSSTFLLEKNRHQIEAQKTASETRKTNPLANQMNKLKIISVNLKYDDEDRGDVLARRRRSECSSFLKEINEECERREEESK